MPHLTEAENWADVFWNERYEPTKLEQMPYEEYDSWGDMSEKHKNELCVAIATEYIDEGEPLTSAEYIREEIDRWWEETEYETDDIR